MRGIIVIILMGLAEIALAQTPAPPPQLTKTEQLALHSLQEEFSQVNKDFQELQKDIEKNHPGYTLNPQTGNLEPVKPATPAKK